MGNELFSGGFLNRVVEQPTGICVLGKCPKTNFLDEEDVPHQDYRGVIARGRGETVDVLVRSKV